MVTDVFTFGFAHTHPHTGRPLRNMFVEITAPNHEAARVEMFARFGSKWAMHYPSREKAGVERFGLTCLEAIKVVGHCNDSLG
jgi:hypothetical protein